MSRPRLVFLVRDGLGQPARVLRPESPRDRRATYREARALARAGYIGGAVSVAEVPAAMADPWAPSPHGVNLSMLVVVAQWVRVKSGSGLPRCVGGEL